MRQVPILSKNFRYVFPFFIVIILDAIGSGIIAPILAPMLSQTGNHWLGNSSFVQHISYGLILASFPFFYMLGAPILGALSDIYGRKKILLVCLLGALIGFVFYALSFKYNSLFLLVLGRMVAGITSGSQGVAQAAMADISQENDKASNFGLIAVALTIGLVAGPLLGGVLSNSQLVSWFNLSTPFYVVIVLGIINLILLLLTIQDQYQKKLSSALSVNGLARHFQSFFQLFRERKIAKILLVFFLFELGWSLYYQALALLLVKSFSYSATGIGLFASYVGAMLSISLIILVRSICPRYSLKAIVSISLLVGVISLMLIFLLPGIYAQYLLVIAITGVVALVYTSLITFASKRVSTYRQGLLMGTTDSLLALAFSITGLLSGWLGYYSVQLPFLMAAFFWLLSLILAITME